MSQVAPTFYLNPDNGVSYSIVMQTPQYKMDSLSALQALPITASGNTQAPILGGIADVKRSTSSAVVSQYDIQPMVQIFATPQGRDLGAVAADVRAVMADTAKDVPKGSTVVLLTMNPGAGMPSTNGTTGRTADPVGSSTAMTDGGSTLRISTPNGPDT